MKVKELFSPYKKSTEDALDKYKFVIRPQEYTLIIEGIKRDNPTEIGIDTETDGLNPVFSTPYNIIVGWYDQNKIYQHYVIYMPDREQAKPFVDAMLREFEKMDILQVFHNAKYDINMLQNVVGEWYRPKHFCTILGASHATKLNIFGLKPIASFLKIRSRFEHLEEIWNQIAIVNKDSDGKNITVEYEPNAADILQKAVDDGLIPGSRPVINNITKIRNGETNLYFYKLFNEADDLVDFYKKVYTEKIEAEFDAYKAKHNWTLTLRETYNTIKDVYSYGDTYEKARLVLREFNKDMFGYSNEWVELYKGSSTLKDVSYEILNLMDSAALTMYAGMDVKLTLDLYSYIRNQMAGWTPNQHKTLQIDFDVTYAILQQEKLGFKLDIPYIEEGIPKLRKALRSLSQAIEEKFDFITKGVDWKEEVGMSKTETLQANEYSAYDFLFTKYIPFVKLPVFCNPKAENKLTSISKFLNITDILRKGHIGTDGTAPKEDDIEMMDTFIDANSETIDEYLIGSEEDNWTGGVSRELFIHMMKEAQRVIAERDKDIQAGLEKERTKVKTKEAALNAKLIGQRAALAEAEANGRPTAGKAKSVANTEAKLEVLRNTPIQSKVKYRTQELDIIEAQKTSKNMFELMEALNKCSPKVRKVGNEYLKGLDIKVTPVKRTINKDTTVPLLRTDVDKLNISEAEKAIATEALEIIRMKKSEATIAKWLGIYGIRLMSEIGASPDQRLRTSYRLFKTNTGRLSGDTQQFPKGSVTNPFNPDEVLYNPRKAFLTSTVEHFDGEQAITAYEDFSQMELRVAAEYTYRYGMPDPALLGAYVPWGMYHPEYGLFNLEQHKDIWMNDRVRYWDDVNKEWAYTYNWYSKPTEFTDELRWEPVDLHLAPVKVAFPHMFDENGNANDEFKGDIKKYRNVCKQLNFGGLYGQGLNGLLSNGDFADFSRDILKTLYYAHKETYQNLKLFQSTVMRSVRKYGYCENLFGRRYIKGFPFGKDRFGQGYQFAYRGTNYLIQGECATLLKDRMIAMEKYIFENNLKARLIQNIHDEVAITMPLSEKEHIFHLRDIIQDSPWKVNMISDIEVTVTNWAEKEEVITMEDIDKVIENNINRQI